MPPSSPGMTQIELDVCHAFKNMATAVCDNKLIQKDILSALNQIALELRKLNESLSFKESKKDGLIGRPKKSVKKETKNV